jgi:RimJ/RimL family protein N-acetyltransferase
MYGGAFKFIDYCFSSFSLRKIYIEVPGYNLVQFSSILEYLFELDATIEERDFHAGRYWPLTVAHLSRERWETERVRWSSLFEPIEER